MNDAWNDINNKLLAELSRHKPPPQPRWKKLGPLIGFLLYPVWGVISSALILNGGFSSNQIVLAIAGIGFAGLLPVALHLYEVASGKTLFEWKTVFICVSLGGIVTLFLGTMLQGILILCHVHSVFGLRIDTWYW